MAPSARVSRLLAVLPQAWRVALGASVITPMVGGESAASVFRVQSPDTPERYIKLARREAAEDLRREAERTRWLGERGLPVPGILDVHDAGVAVVVMMGAVPGRSPRDCGRPAGEVVALVAAAVAALHAVPLDDCPYDETVAIRLARAVDDIARGAVDPDAFDARNAGVAPERLYRRLESTRPAMEDLVVVHGDATFDNILIDDDGRVGFIDCGRAGRADRYVDLTLLATEIEDHFGAAWVAPFWRAYGLPSWDAGKARWFSDLYELF